MGSNANRHGDKKAAREWGRRARKEEAHRRRSTFDEEVIEDELDPRPTPGGKRRKKNTRKWCRGKEGREHQEFLMESTRGRWWAFDKYRCEVCGKERTEWHR